MISYIFISSLHEVSHLLPIIDSLARKGVFTGVATPSATLSITLSKSNGWRNAPWNIKGTAGALSHIYGNLCFLKSRFLPSSHLFLCLIHLKVTIVSVKPNLLCSLHMTDDVHFFFLGNVRKNSKQNNKRQTLVLVWASLFLQKNNTICVAVYDAETVSCTFSYSNSRGLLQKCSILDFKFMFACIF